MFKDKSKRKAHNQNRPLLMIARLVHQIQIILVLGIKNF